MDSLPKLLVILLASLLLSSEVWALDNLKCRGQPVTFTEKQIQNIKDCGVAVGVTNPEKMSPDKIGCFSKCVLEKKELVDQAGKPHQENINKLIDSTMPEIARADAKTKFSGCLELHGGKIDPKDASCASYMELAMCTHKAMMEVCKPE